MGWFPKAKRVPTPYGGHVPRNRQGRGILHVAVSNARSLPPWNQNTWHMYVAKDGSCEQYVDSDFRAFASADANDDAFSIETAGGVGSTAQVNAEKWTSEQMQTLAEIMVWRKHEDGTPLDVLPDSKPGRRGWGPHRLGIDPWRVPGGESWSAHYGKLCPGDAKVAQIPAIVMLARIIDSGGVAPVSPIIEEDDDMAFMLQVRKGDPNGGRLTFCGAGFAQHVSDGKDDQELRQTEKLPVYTLSADLVDRVIADIRA